MRSWFLTHDAMKLHPTNEDLFVGTPGCVMDGAPGIVTGGVFSFREAEML